MGNQPSQLEREAQSIISRVWDDDPSTKDASINFAKECLDHLTRLQHTLAAAAPHALSAARLAEIEMETCEVLVVLDSYLQRMVGKLYLQCDPRTGKFDHPLLFRFWRYDPAKGRYAQTRSGRGLSICTGQPRALHVLRSEPLIQELELPLPHESGDTSTNAGSNTFGSNTRTPANPRDGRGGGGGERGEVAIQQQQPQHAATTGEASAMTGSNPPSDPSSAATAATGGAISPLQTVMPPTPFAQFSVPAVPQAPHLHHSTSLPSSQQQQQQPPHHHNHHHDPSSNAVVVYNPSSSPVHRRVCLVFRGQVIHPLARLRDFPLSGGVLDLVLLRDDDTFHPDLIDEAQVRMLSAHSVIGRHSAYVDVLYRLATKNVLATLIARQQEEVAASSRTAAAATSTQKTAASSSPLRKLRARSRSHSAKRARSASDGSGNSSGSGFVQKFLHRLSSTVNHVGTSYLLPQQEQQRHQQQRHSTSSVMESPISIHAWNILTSLREPRMNARLLVDLFDQAQLERDLLLRQRQRQRRRSDKQNNGAAAGTTAAKGDVYTGPRSTHVLEAVEPAGATTTATSTLASRVLSHVRGTGASAASEPELRTQQQRAVGSSAATDEDDDDGELPLPFVLPGGLPVDLARLIDSFVPNRVQCSVMNV